MSSSKTIKKAHIVLAHPEAKSFNAQLSSSSQRVLGTAGKRLRHSIRDPPSSTTEILITTIPKGCFRVRRFTRHSFGKTRTPYRSRFAGLLSCFRVCLLC